LADTLNQNSGETRLKPRKTKWYQFYRDSKTAKYDERDIDLIIKLLHQEFVWLNVRLQQNKDDEDLYPKLVDAWTKTGALLRDFMKLKGITVSEDDLSKLSDVVETKITNNNLAMPSLLILDRVFTKIYYTMSIIGRTRTHIYEIPHVVGKSLTKLYGSRDLAGKLIIKLHDSIAVVKLNARIYVVRIASKTLTKLRGIAESGGTETRRLFYNILTQVVTKVKHGSLLPKEDWKVLLRTEVQKIVEVSRIPVLKSEIPESREGEKKEEGFRNAAELMLKPDVESVAKRVKELEWENLYLRHKLWKLKYRGTRAIAIILTSTGGASLLISYLYSSLILTFIGLGLTLWGAVIFYVLPSRHVPEETIGAIALYMIKTIDNLLTSLGCKGRTIFHYSKHLNGLTQGYLFIPYDNIYGIPQDQDQEKLFHDTSKGVSIIAPSQGLVELFEKELNVNLASVDLAYVQENLPKLLIEDLRLIDDLSIENTNGTMHVKIIGRSCAHICDSINKQTQLGNYLGCPLCGALALVISKVTGKPVAIKESNVKNDSIETSYLTLDA